MSNMFRGSSFDHDIGDWDVSKVISFEGMFASTSFNQDISEWDVSNANNFQHMFLYNSEFDQNLQYWNADRLYFNKSMFAGADKMLAKGWSSRPSKSDFGKIRITDRSSLETAIALWLASEDAATEAYGLSLIHI